MCGSTIEWAVWKHQSGNALYACFAQSPVIIAMFTKAAGGFITYLNSRPQDSFDGKVPVLAVVALRCIYNPAISILGAAQ